MAFEFRLLGDVQALRDGRPLVLGSARPRSVLAALLVDANRIVTLDEVINRVWGDAPPAQARASVHSYFTRLRSALEGESAIVRRGHGYLLETDPATIDLHRFREAAALARGAANLVATLRHLDSALKLWRGTPFAGLDSGWLADMRTVLEAEHEAIVLDQTDARLRLGQHTQLVAELTHRAELNPLNERLAAQLMLALYRTGRQADALIHFQRVKALLGDELGIDPNAALRAVYQGVLEEDPRLALPNPLGAEPSVVPAPESTGQPRTPPDPDGERSSSGVPRQLPSAPQSFVGRDDHLAALSDALIPAGDATRLAVVSGSGGMGKTWLALHWAHQHADHFPDGQLFINMHGFGTEVRRVSLRTAMRALLQAFQIPAQAIPENYQALTGLYRSVLAGKRLLLVIDNAQDAEQIAALIPGSPNCSVVVTSRNRLTSLVSNHNANLLVLDVLSPVEARTLLTSRLGPETSPAEVAAREELLAVCGGLPLALSITIGRAHEHPGFSTASLVADLHNAGSALNTLEVDAELSIRAVLSTSYAALTPDQAYVFQVLGLLPGPDIGVPAASAMTNLSYAATRTLVRELERASLIQQHVPGRFRMHDLVCLYAQEKAEEQLPPDTRATALHRLAEFYLHTAVCAAQVMEPGRARFPIAAPAEGCQPLTLRTAEAAQLWFESEERNLRAIHDLAQGFGWHEVVWRLSWANIFHFNTAGRGIEMLDRLYAALTAAKSLGDLRKLAYAHRSVATLVARMGYHEEAAKQMILAVDAANRSENTIEQTLTLVRSMELNLRAQNMKVAVADGDQAWQLMQGQSSGLRQRVTSAFGWILAMDGQYDRAREMCEISLDLIDEIGNRVDRIPVLDTLGYIYRSTGKLEQATSHLHEAVNLCSKYSSESSNANFNLADVLCTLGETYHELGRHQEAGQHLERALRMFQEQQRAQEAQRAKAALDALQMHESRPDAAS